MATRRIKVTNAEDEVDMNGNDAEESAQRMAVEEDALIARTSRASESQPYRMVISIIGTSPILFHAWKNVLPDDPGPAGKGDKKRDNLED